MTHNLCVLKPVARMSCIAIPAIIHSLTQSLAHLLTHFSCQNFRSSDQGCRHGSWSAQDDTYISTWSMHEGTWIKAGHVQLCCLIYRQCLCSCGLQNLCRVTREARAPRPGWTAKLIGRGQNILPAGLIPGRTPSCLLLEPGKPAIGFF